MSVCGAIYLQGVAHRTADCGLRRTMADIIYYSSKSKGKRGTRERADREEARQGEQESRREESNHEAWRGCCGRRSFQSISFVFVIDIL